MSTAELLTLLSHWQQNDLIRAVDYQFARMVSTLPDAEADTVLLAALVSHELASGNVCLPLEHLQQPDDYWPEAISETVKQLLFDFDCPLNQIVGTGHDQVNTTVTPLVSEHQRIYLHRYWVYECEVAKQLQQRSTTVSTDSANLSQRLTELFPSSAQDEIDWQKVAAAIAVQKQFSVISGGPGTGKTTTVTKLLLLYVEQALLRGEKPIIKLAAPTGKAAARLSESIGSTLEKLDITEQLSEFIPTQATTLHRLLGVIPNRTGFRHNRHNPLHLDLLLLDEASMIDLPMMARLLEALPENARILLLGDRDQLASVEAGSVLADICNWPGELAYTAEMRQSINQLCNISLNEQQGAESPIADSLALLRKSYRFHAESGIGHLARAVNEGNSYRASQVLKQGYQDLNHLPLSDESYAEMIKRLVDFYADLTRSIHNGETVDNLLEQMSCLQLLCANRSGPYGVEGINQHVRDGLSKRGIIRGEGEWYPGRPVLVTSNDPSLNLFNGDIGITVTDEEGRLRVWFKQQDGLKAYLPSRIPSHETVYAMTIHKSQGSEFDEVILLMPLLDGPLVTRELLYTGITRAKNKLNLLVRNEILNLACKRTTERYGGLSRRLWLG